jgi:hypothetical protein
LSNPSGYGSALTAALLLWPTVAYASAPLNSIGAQRAALPPELRARRRTEYLRNRTARRVTYALSGLTAAGVAAAVAVSLLTPGNSPVRTPQLVGPAKGHDAHYGQPATQQPSAPGSSSTSAPASPTPSTSSSSSSSTSPTPTTTSATTSSSTSATTSSSSSTP